MKKISIIVPCYNEQESLQLLYQELCKLMKAEPAYAWEILFVNDGSKDETLQVIQALSAQDPSISYVDLSRNYGKETAMLAGFDYAQGDACVIIDADMQDPPSLIPQMIKKWEEGYDDVYARRVDRGKESWLRRKLSMAYYRLLTKSSRIDVLPNVGDFRLLDKRCIEALRTLREQGRYTKGMFCYIGFRKAEITFDRQDRAVGSSKMSYRSLFHLAIEGLMSYTTAPLRMASILGLLVSLISFIYALWILVKTLIWGDPVAGFPTLMVVILFLGGVQLLALGVLGEYVGRIFHESKHRPNYFVQTYYSSKK